MARYKQVITNTCLSTLMKEAKCNDKLRSLERYVEEQDTLIYRCFDDVETRLESLEAKFYFDPEVTIIIQGIPSSSSEKTMNVADKLVTEGFGVSDITIVTAKRLLNKVDPTKPGLLKIEVKDLEQKKRLLNNKRSLNNHQNRTDRDVYVRSSKSHVERILELNTQMLLQEIPTGYLFRLTANGRLIRKDNTRGYNRPQNNHRGYNQLQDSTEDIPSNSSPKVHHSSTWSTREWTTWPPTWPTTKSQFHA